MTVVLKGAATCPDDVRVRAEAVLAGLVTSTGSPARRRVVGGDAGIHGRRG